MRELSRRLRLLWAGVWRRPMRTRGDLWELSGGLRGLWARLRRWPM
ncbi:MAG: hypothetical protein RMK74_08170 [Myxococcales bacterium]|nr:hypothetical protein [Myxococcales bacterium]